MTGQALTPATAEQVAAARTASDALGLYFQLADPVIDHQPGWRSAAELYELKTGPLDELLDTAAERLGSGERRVAASLFYQGYAARLLSPQLGCLITGGHLPFVPADQLRYRAPATELIQLGLPPSPGWQGPVESLLDELLDRSFTAHLLPLATAIQARTSLSAAILHDNAASALINGLRLLAPRLEEGDWRPLATRALAHQNLRGSGNLRAAEPAFVRRSCCLYYRTPAGGLCGDCPLA
ncbi:MAG TPA: (2Fe-2S)-binding protein [Streptosporangiaceae bacterium]